MDMVAYLIKNHMIKHSAYDKIKELGGELSDGLNCRVPVRNLDEDGLEGRGGGGGERLRGLWGAGMCVRERG